MEEKILFNLIELPSNNLEKIKEVSKFDGKRVLAKDRNKRDYIQAQLKYCPNDSSAYYLEYLEHGQKQEERYEIYNLEKLLVEDEE